MAKHTQRQEDLTITLRDFVPPFVFKIGRWLELRLFGEDVSESEKAIQLIAFLLVLSTLALAILAVQVLPSTVASVVYSFAKDTYVVKLTDEAYQKAYAYQVEAWFNYAAAVGEIERPDYYRQGAVLGVTDEPVDSQDDGLFDITPTPTEETEEAPQSMAPVEQSVPTEYTLTTPTFDAGTYYSYVY